MKEKYLVDKAGIILMIALLSGCGRSPDMEGPQGVMQDKPAVEQESAARSREQEPEQALEEYTFNGFSEGTNRRWEVKGRSAEIFSEFIKMFNVRAQAFAEDGSVSVTATAQEGRMFMGTNNVRMEKEVVITTPDGAKLTTDYLDWAAKTETATTDARVVVQKDNIMVEGQGAEGRTDLQEVKVNKDVKVTVYDQAIVPALAPGREEEKNKKTEDKRPTVITCDGKLEIDYEKNLAKFFDNVVLDDKGGKVYADQMDIYIDPKTKEVTKAVAAGHVKIEEATKVSYCEKAVYDLQLKKIILLPSSETQVRVIIYPGEGGKIAPFGN